jgi:hypothetical protein
MQPSRPRPEPLSDEAFRTALRAIVERTGRSLRSLSLAMGRDAGYLAALLDPSRPSRARPTPVDLLALSDATGIPFVELLETLWAIPRDRLADELDRTGPDATGRPLDVDLVGRDRELLATFAAFLADRRRAATKRSGRG